MSSKIHRCAAAACCLVGFALSGCGSEAERPLGARQDTMIEPVAPAEIAPINPAWQVPPPDPQRPGDAARGYDVLMNFGYSTCGVPYSAWKTRFGVAAEEDRLPGRTGINSVLPYNYGSAKTKRGVDVVLPNCLDCHADKLNGEIVMGLGATTRDWTMDMAAAGRLSRFLISDPSELAEFDFWFHRIELYAPMLRLDTVGPTPGTIAFLSAHHDPKTLAWSDEPVFETPKANPPIDPPPWWNTKKKNALYYTSSGRGDHSRLMIVTPALCTDTVDEFLAIDAEFPDVRAYILSLEPPPYPYDVDQKLADEGRAVFEATCAECHGTYGPGGRYFNVNVPIADIGTDPLLLTANSWEPARAWFRESPMGALSKLEPDQGYLAPPLNGVWATPPYLHNGSVPTVAALLDSSSRPTYWTRNFDETEIDTEALGVRHTVLEAGQADEPDESKRARIYDTTHTGYGNRGHTFGDALTPPERRAVIEYLKTL